MKTKNKNYSRKHFWTYVPELGQDWRYCTRCNKAQKISGGKIYSFQEALKIVESQLETTGSENKMGR